MYGLIYCITNAVNGKQYVGQTVRTLEQRWQFHLRAAREFSGCALHSAIRKYGIEAFAIQQIDVAESQDELNEKEIHHVARLGTLAPGGYNLTSGGKQTRLSEETCKKISEANKGRVISGEARRNMSKAVQFRPQVSSSTRSKLSERVISEETCEKLSRALRKVSCRRGHQFNDVNTYTNPLTGARQCWICWKLYSNRKLPKKVEERFVEEKTAQ
jgi:group I intron endonuclease